MKRSITIASHRTSVWLEDPFWDGLAEIAALQDRSVASVIEDIDRGRGSETNLSSAIRMAVLAHYRKAAGAAQLGD